MCNSDEAFVMGGFQAKGIVPTAQQFAVALCELRGGKVYFPELSNIQARSIGKNVVIHSHVWIGDKVSIPDYMKIQAFVFIPNGVSFEKGVFLGPRVCFTNDRNPPHDEYLETHVEEHAAIGAGAVILPGITIGKHSLIGAGSVITKDVPAFSVVVGNPGKVIRMFRPQKMLKLQPAAGEP